MKQLTCEMCGSNNLVKQDGMFVCQDCGTKYSVEEAKKMMVEGTVRVDNSHMISNYLEMAQSAKDAGNNTEAESYCNKVIEIEPTNYKAWMIKGEAAAWQSTLQNSRVDEGVAAFVKGINNAPEEEKEELIEYTKEQIKNLSSAMILLRADRFSKWPDEEEANGFISDIASILSTVVGFLTQTGALIPLAEIMSPIATQINQSVINAWQSVIWPEYNGDPNDSDDRASKYEWQTFIKRVGFCTALLEKAINLCDEDEEDDVTCYENLIFIHEAAIDSCSWDYEFTSWGKIWHKEWMLTDDAKNSRRTLIRQYEAKIAEIKRKVEAKKAAEKAEQERIAKEESQKRFDAYWTEHADEKVQFEAERDGLNDQIKVLQSGLNDQLAELNKEIAAIPGASEIANFDARIKQLFSEKAALGLFKGKEKKALQEQIDQASTLRKAIQDKMNSERQTIESKINMVKSEFLEKANPLQSRIQAINTELTKER